MAKRKQEAVAVVAVEDVAQVAPPVEPIKVEQPLMFTAAAVRNWFEDADKAVADRAETGRITILLRLVANVDTDTLRKGLGELVDGHAKGTPERKIWLTRNAEVKALYGCQRFAPDSLPRDKGYHATVAAARAGLVAIKRKWSGDPLKDEHLRKAEKAAKAETAAMLMARTAFHDVLNRTGDAEAAEKAEQLALATERDAILQAEADKIARGIWKRYGKDGTSAGVEMVEAIISALIGLMQQGPRVPAEGGTR